MKKSFTLGAVSGITALAIGFPFAAQLAGAQEAASSSATAADKPGFERHAPLSQDEVQAMVDRDNAILTNIDAFVAIQKKAIQNHRIALQAAVDIQDETERNDAVRAANQAMRAEIDAALEADPALKDAMPFGPMMGHGKGPRPGMAAMRAGIAETLGMTKEEIKAALGSGKTIEDLAKEKGVELPERRMGMHGTADLAAKLGMTEEELKAALDSGKTPRELAEEKGITLPVRPAFGGPRR
jgi:hypothetical protein